MTAENVAAGVWCLPLRSSTLPPFDSTNTYLIADNGVGVVVDPGFSDEEALTELSNLIDAQGVRLIKAILLTHTHGDHLAGVDLVAGRYERPTIYVHPQELQRVESSGAQALGDERVLTVGDLTVHALHTPGHSPGHLSFHLPDRGVLLAGDLVAGGASVWVGVPEGDMQEYLQSLERLADLDRLTILGPGHGHLVRDPRHRLREAREHRLEREMQVVEALAAPRLLGELRDSVYGELPERLRAPAEATLLAHLKKLMGEMRVVHLGEDEQGPFVVRS